MQVDLLYFAGCRWWEEALASLKFALAAEGLDAAIRLVKLDNDEEAMHLKFLGSPSFQVEGVDLWLEERDHYNLNCRVYHTPQGLRGAPSVEMFREKLRALHA